MSLAKDLIAKKEFYHRIAYEWLLQESAIKTCDIHEDFYYITGLSLIESDELYRNLTTKLKKEYGEDQDYKLFHSVIHDILSVSSTNDDDCPFCEKLIKEE